MPRWVGYGAKKKLAKNPKKVLVKKPKKTLVKKAATKKLLKRK